MNNQEFLEYILEKLENLDGFSSGKMFGGYVLRRYSLPIALIFQNEIFLKADAENKSFYQDAGAEVFYYHKGGKRIEISNYKVPAEILEDDKLFEKWIMTAYEAAKRIEMKKFKYQL